MCNACKAYKKELELRRKAINQTICPALKDQKERQQKVRHQMASGWNDLHYDTTTQTKLV